MGSAEYTTREGFVATGDKTLTRCVRSGLGLTHATTTRGDTYDAQEKILPQVIRGWGATAAVAHYYYYLRYVRNVRNAIFEVHVRYVRNAI